MTHTDQGKFEIFLVSEFNFSFIRWLNYDLAAAPGSHIIGGGNTNQAKITIRFCK